MRNRIKQTQPINKPHAAEAVRGQKRPHYAEVRLREVNVHSPDGLKNWEWLYNATENLRKVISNEM